MLKVHPTRSNLAAADSHQHFSDQTQKTQLHTDLANIALQAMPQAIVIVDCRGCLRYFNDSAQKFFYQDSGAQILGQPFESIFRLLHHETCEPLQEIFERLNQLETSFEVNDQAVLVTAQDTVFAIDLTVSPTHNETGQSSGAVVLLRDVTHARQANHVLSWQANHDALTGLVNRREFENQLNQAILETRNGDIYHTLCYIDLDQFKIVNDTCGHNAGDDLLRRLTQIFQREIRRSDTLSRIGGDEFGILLYNCSLQQAEQTIQRIHEQVGQFRFLWNDQGFKVTASFGLVEINETSDGLTAVLSAADAACYAAKEAGRNRIHLFHNDDDELARQRSERLWISQIHQAIEEQRFKLYAQDIVPIAPHQKLVEQQAPDALEFERHVEILLRMIDRDGKTVPPGCFIPAAERYGLMTALDKVVIETFFSSYAQACLSNSGRPLDSCLYAINLSARSLNDAEFIDFVKSQFAKYRLPPHVICFEITETAAISNVDQASQFIQELKQMGCHFALDDFGSGMNCFAYLKQLKIDYLKIDGSFIKNITQETIDRELVTCMNRIAHVLGVKTVAEWVENNEILQTLASIGIDYAQGYGLHKPEPLEFTLMS